MFDGAQTHDRVTLHNVSLTTRCDLTNREAELTGADWARFRAKVAVGEPDACWLWTASCTGRGYGQLTVGRGKLAAHRLAWVLSHGPIPADAHVLHRCDRPRCCNPAHLFLGTHADNMQDAAAKRRLSVPRPGRHKVSTEQLAEIDALLRAGEPKAWIARQFGVSKTWVGLYAKGQRRQYDSPKPKTEAA